MVSGWHRVHYRLLTSATAEKQARCGPAIGKAAVGAVNGFSVGKCHCQSCSVSMMSACMSHRVCAGGGGGDHVWFRLKDMADKWQYDGDSTCAADGMCAVGVSMDPVASTRHC